MTRENARFGADLQSVISVSYRPHRPPPEPSDKRRSGLATSTSALAGADRRRRGQIRTIDEGRPGRGASPGSPLGRELEQAGDLVEWEEVAEGFSVDEERAGADGAALDLGLELVDGVLQRRFFVNFVFFVGWSFLSIFSIPLFSFFFIPCPCLLRPFQVTHPRSPFCATKKHEETKKLAQPRPNPATALAVFVSHAWRSRYEETRSTYEETAVIREFLRFLRVSS
jgi:hypothetical protein